MLTHPAVTFSPASSGCIPVDFVYSQVLFSSRIISPQRNSTQNTYSLTGEVVLKGIVDTKVLDKLKIVLGSVRSLSLNYVRPPHPDYS